MARGSIGSLSADGEKVIGLGTEAWNIADGFTKIKILRILIEMDLFETVASFGRKDVEEQIDPDDIPYRRFEALERLLFSLKQLIGNCRFSIDKGYDTKKVSLLLERIRNVEEVIEGVATHVTNHVTKETTLKINEEHFRKCSDILRDVKDELNFLLNKNGLIFRQSDELDIDAIMKSVEEGG